MVALVANESGLDPYAIGDNSMGRSHHPRDAASAEALAGALIAAGHSIDMGLAQIKSWTAPRLGLSVRDAFDPCRNVAAARRLMATTYRRVAPSSPTVQHAIVRTLSTYNTGNAWRGFRNGYVDRVYRAAAIVVPRLGRAAGIDAHSAPIDRVTAASVPPDPPRYRTVAEPDEPPEVAPAWVAFGDPVNVMVFGGDGRGPLSRKEKQQ